MPHENPGKHDPSSLYRIVLKHGYFGVQNATVVIDFNRQPDVTSLFDFETGCLVPAILSDPEVAVCPDDINVDSDGEIVITKVPKNSTSSEMEVYKGWARCYIQALHEKTPDCRVAIETGKDIRQLWFALRNWRDGNSEEFFSGLGKWAEKRMQELQ